MLLLFQIPCAFASILHCKIINHVSADAVFQGNLCPMILIAHHYIPCHNLQMSGAKACMEQICQGAVNQDLLESSHLPQHLRLSCSKGGSFPATPCMLVVLLQQQPHLTGHISHQPQSLHISVNSSLLRMLQPPAGLLLPVTSSPILSSSNNTGSSTPKNSRNPCHMEILAAGSIPKERLASS